jgi:hypothetical protein
MTYNLEQYYNYLKSEYDSALKRAEKVGHIGKTRYVESLEICMKILEYGIRNKIKIEMEKETLLYQLLKKHAGHNIEIAEYGDGTNFSLEDTDTNEVIFDTDIYDLKGRESF